MNNLNCEWNITARPGYFVHLVFIDFYFGLLVDIVLVSDRGSISIFRGFFLLNLNFPHETEKKIKKVLKPCCSSLDFVAGKICLRQTVRCSRSTVFVFATQSLFTVRKMFCTKSKNLRQLQNSVFISQPKHKNDRKTDNYQPSQSAYRNALLMVNFKKLVFTIRAF